MSLTEAVERAKRRIGAWCTGCGLQLTLFEYREFGLCVGCAKEREVKAGEGEYVE